MSEDPRAPFDVSKDLYEANTKAAKKKRVFDDETHCTGSDNYPDICMKEVKELLKKNR
ncbi:MAG: hypothetical protein Q4F05_09955 [bacterium]|nr:hypothetical protein [bacterium]